MRGVGLAAADVFGPGGECQGAFLSREYVRGREKHIYIYIYTYICLESIYLQVYRGLAQSLGFAGSRK